MLVPTNLFTVLKILDGDELLDDDWMVSRKFSRDGREVFVQGFGKTRAEAFLDFEKELETEKTNEYN